MKNIFCVISLVLNKYLLTLDLMLINHFLFSFTKRYFVLFVPSKILRCSLATLAEVTDFFFSVLHDNVVLCYFPVVSDFCVGIAVNSSLMCFLNESNETVFDSCEILHILRCFGQGKGTTLLL